MKLIKLRIVCSLAIFILFLMLFVGGEEISVFLSAWLLPFQVVPALIRVMTQPEILFVVGLVSVFVLTLIFGRVYCSFLCPLGILQDIIIALSRKTGLRKKQSFQKPQNALRYSILLTVFITAVMGSMSLLNLLDPYSLIGRMINHLINPIITGVYNASTSLLKYFEIFLFTKKTVYLPISVVAATALFFLFIVLFSARKGRLYCNAVCPVGAVLGLISRISLFKIVLDGSKCNNCIRCTMVCKGGCIDTEEKALDYDRCVGCFNCLDACPQSAVNYRPVWGKTQTLDWSPARRAFIIGATAAAGSGFMMFNTGLRNLLNTAHGAPLPPVTPPGSISIEHFSKTCTACHLCVSTCPTKVITPSLTAYGISGFLQPKMNFTKSSCEYECNLCGRVCPTGAILPLPLEEKKLTQIGKVELFRDTCIVYQENKNCGACGEFCPTQAIYSVSKNNVLYPETDDQYCIGCGICEKACPTTPKSIVVHSNPVHQKAKLNTKLYDPEPVLAPATGSKKTSSEDFPF